jgi:peptidoglycan/LPS O-acetylase OafA/YrhL
MSNSLRTIILWVVLIIMGVVMYSLDKVTPEQREWLFLVPVLLLGGILVMAFSERGARK